jgi:transcriptional regulator with XRE-family HTH domain
MDHTLADYMNAAIERQRLRSDRALAQTMNVAQQIVSRWRRGTAYPTEPQMLRLAKLAEANEEQALVLYRTWNATDDETRDTYRRLLQRFNVTGTGLAVAVAASLALGNSPEQGRGWSISQLTVALIDHYGKFRRFSRRVAAALAKLRDLGYPRSAELPRSRPSPVSLAERRF